MEWDNIQGYHGNILVSNFHVSSSNIPIGIHGHNNDAFLDLG
jgi:hypothetical protein